MLSKSGTSLLSNAEGFIENSASISIFSAYIKLEVLKKLNTKNNIQQIVVRWEIQDLCLGVSDLELYEYCKENKITLYRNTRIHLKAIWDNQDSVFFGSANITGRGIGEKGNYNFELNGANYNLSIEDKLYLKKIITESEFVDKKLYLKLKALKEANEKKKIIYPKEPTQPKLEDKFLLSQLPMSKNPEFMINGFFDRKSLSKKDEACLVNDLANFNLDLNLGRSAMVEQLRVNFNRHPFILALKDHIKLKDSQSLRYGGVVRWIQHNTTTVPTPRSWEMKKKKIVNILYEWICYFDDRFYWDIPGSRSQVIFYKSQEDVLLLINESRDKARGEIAPHQIILVAALRTIYEETRSKIITFPSANYEFQDLWRANQKKFKSTNANIGLPIKALTKKQLIKVNSINEIQDYRNIKNLERAITSLELGSDLIKLFEQSKDTKEILAYL